jgi:hypothetical protein
LEKLRADNKSVLPTQILAGKIRPSAPKNYNSAETVIRAQFILATNNQKDGQWTDSVSLLRE